MDPVNCALLSEMNEVGTQVGQIGIKNERKKKHTDPSEECKTTF